MFKKLITSTIAIFSVMLLLTGCDDAKKENQITVGVAAGPYGDMFKQAIAPGLEKKVIKSKSENSVIMYNLIWL